MQDTSLEYKTLQGAHSSSVKSAERVMSVLTVLSRHTRPVPTMAIARECGIPKSSTHHLLNVMRDRQFVTYYEAERAWGLGVAVFEIGAAYQRSGPLQRLGRPLLAELANRTGETAHLAVLHGTEVLYLDKERPRGPTPKLVTEVGVRLPAHLTAVGLAILAELPDAQLDALYSDEPLVVRTGAGPADLDALRRDLAAVRERGHAVDNELVTPGISCVACPVFSHEQIAIAALGVTFVSAQREDADHDEIVDVVSDVADRLSVQLGHPGGSR